MATSSRRRPATRRLPPKAGSPACSGVMRARRDVRNSRISRRLSTRTRLGRCTRQLGVSVSTCLDRHSLLAGSNGTGGHSLPSGRVAQRSSPRQLPCGGAPKPQAHNERRTRDSPPRSLPLRLILWSSRVSALGAHVRAVTAHTVGAAREMMLTTTSTGHLCSPANRGPISHRACECCALPDGSHWAPARR